MSPIEREKITPPPSPLQRMKNPFIRHLSPSPVSFRARSRLRLGILIIAAVVIISVLNELRCMKYGCASRVGFYGGEQGYVGGGSVLPKFGVSIGGNKSDSNATKLTQHKKEKEKEKHFGEGDLVRTTPKGDLVKTTPKENKNGGQEHLKDPPKTEGKGKWVDDEKDMVLKGTQRPEKKPTESEMGKEKEMYVDKGPLVIGPEGVISGRPSEQLSGTAAQPHSSETPAANASSSAKTEVQEKALSRVTSGKHPVDEATVYQPTNAEYWQPNAPSEDPTDLISIPSPPSSPSSQHASPKSPTPSPPAAAPIHDISTPHQFGAMEMGILGGRRRIL